MTKEKAMIRNWLWMEAVRYAPVSYMRDVRQHIYRIEDRNEYRFESWDDCLREIYAYALDNWKFSGYQGSGSGHTPVHIGYRFDMSPRGITAKYREIEVVIKWTEIRRFIQKMLDPPTLEDRQMDLIELLSMEGA